LRAYKDIHAVVKNQVENGQVEVVDYFKPIIVVKERKITRMAPYPTEITRAKSGKID